MAAFVEAEFQHLKIELEEIKSATNNFDDTKVIGSGGFGKVYEGEISHSKGRSLVAFKRLDGKFGQGWPEFVKEVRMLSRYTHKNLISLLGICSQGDEMILAYEHASRGSLDRHLKDATLNWMQRLKICLDAAKGLSFLHDPRGTHQRLIHCDIKSANILLDDRWNAKVSDFGLSKIGPVSQHNSVLVTSTLGTYGYCDPVFMQTYCLTKESDVYSFGVVLFEVLCGRLCTEYSNGQLKVLVSIWKKWYEENKLEEIIFEYIMQKIDHNSLKIFSDIAYKCLNITRKERPEMSLVVERLEAALKCQKIHDLKHLPAPINRYTVKGIGGNKAEEKALIEAHRNEIEDTMQMLNEELQLLGGVGKPGILFDNYVTLLSYLLSRTIASLVISLQAHVARFQHQLKEQTILDKSSAIREYHVNTNNTAWRSEPEKLQDENVNEILEGEEALNAAQLKEIDDMMEIAREEMKLLTEVEKPGSLIGNYATQLSIMLSRKAACLVRFRARLARFHHRLKQGRSQRICRVSS